MWQWHCRNRWKFFSPISAIPLPQFYSFFFSSHFRQWHCRNRWNFFPPISAIPLPQFYSLFFSSHFRQWHCQNRWKFFSPTSAIPLPQFFFFFSHIFSNGIAEIGKNFLHLFRQSHCHNSIIYFYFYFF